jgi:hypothetical protein
MEIHSLLKDFHLKYIFYVIDKLGIIGFEDILFQLYPVPNKFKDAIHFLQFNFESSLKTHFQKSIEIVSSKFYKFNLTNLPPFSINVFENHERNNTFQIISDKSENDSNFNC